VRCSTPTECRRQRLPWLLTISPRQLGCIKPYGTGIPLLGGKNEAIFENGGEQWMTSITSYKLLHCHSLYVLNLQKFLAWDKFILYNAERSLLSLPPANLFITLLNNACRFRLPTSSFLVSYCSRFRLWFAGLPIPYCGQWWPYHLLSHGTSVAKSPDSPCKNK
jgi:hypothetical protein